ncbi:hypothetical protein HNO88_001396 [Novosphingobium chloroacetimidivorans]|uniref:Uncharacterized protein n=1 Tax=Novosphingobium chloroacetimidivorans TaxID=1428314 RepID=A0A7W7NWG4_9SPHN|nr:hypothetical protein [Novosphingobium chloroacetimidivorans]
MEQLGVNRPLAPASSLSTGSVETDGLDQTKAVVVPISAK